MICKVCEKEYSLKPGVSKDLCGACLANSRRFASKLKMIAYKGSKCSRCGYSKSTRALDFHHRNKEEKLFNISGCHTLKWEKIQKELDKCDLLCANCHREVEEIEYEEKRKLKKEKILKYIFPQKRRVVKKMRSM